MENNEFTTKLFDVVVPQHAFEDVMKVKQLFFVMEYIPFDMTAILNTQSKDEEKSEANLI